jgi:hypothetical protein
MRVLVCGGRDYSNMPLVFATLHDLNYAHGITTIIHGAASGADEIADKWAKERRIPCAVFRADWCQYGKSAGPRRNREMLLHKPDLVVAFPGGRGTADMVRAAKAAGVPVQEVQ